MYLYKQVGRPILMHIYILIPRYKGMQLPIYTCAYASNKLFIYIWNDLTKHYL